MKTSWNCLHHQNSVFNHQKKNSQPPYLPDHLRCDYLSNMIDIGDIIEYRLKSNHSITGKGKVAKFHLSNSGHIRHVTLLDGHRVDDNVCDVRRITLQDLYTGEQLCNPILIWIELSLMIPKSNGEHQDNVTESCFDTSVLYPDAPVAINSLGQSRALQHKRRK